MASGVESTSPGDLAFARDVLRAEHEAIDALSESLDEHFERAVDAICGCVDAGGTVLVSGLGKSGLIGAKIAATLASLGIPSHAVHPAEAAHGDLGRFRPVDLAVCLSFSGETDEVINLAAILRQDGLPIVAISGKRADGKLTTLERLASVPLTLPFDSEGVAGFAAPTTSTTATLALGDALALTAARRREFTDADFRKRHPGGTLGGLLRPVMDVLRFRAGENLPVVAQSVNVRAALAEAEATPRRPGALLISGEGGKLAGIFTDADLRRLTLRDPSALDEPISEVMTREPRRVSSDALVRDALRMVLEHRQDEIPVVDAEGKPVGMLDVQDLIALRLIKPDR